MADIKFASKVHLGVRSSILGCEGDSSILTTGMPTKLMYVIILRVDMVVNMGMHSGATSRDSMLIHTSYGVEL